MGYKLLGFVVWQVGKWYVRRRMRGYERAAAIGGAAAGVAALAIGGAIVAQRQNNSDSE